MRYTIRHLLLILIFCSSASLGRTGAQSVLTAEYDNLRTASNHNETSLNVSNVGSQTFGKLWTYQSFDGAIFAQPLYVPNLLTVSGRKNTLFIATMNNTIYAMNADKPNQGPLWSVHLAPAVPAGYSDQGICPASWSTGSQLGILSTPVIDPATATLYAVASTPVPNTPAAYQMQLFALDIRSGAPKFGNSVVMTGTVPGTGAESVNGTVTLNNITQMQRPALLLQNGVVYAGFGSCGPDPDPYHGWILGYNANNIQRQVAVFNMTPDGKEGSVWQSGRGLVGNGRDLYFMTGNGTVDGVNDFGSSFVRITGAGQLVDWFTPSNADTLNNLDLDLGQGGPLLTPDSHLLVGGGKDGVMYVLNPGNMGQSGSPVQSFVTGTCGYTAFNDCHFIHYPAYWPSATTPTLFVWGDADILRAFPYSGGTFQAGSTFSNGSSAGILTVTAAGQQPGTALLWAIAGGQLRAFSAADISTELWDSAMNSARDQLGSRSTSAQYTVVNGRVYVPYGNNVAVYGLLGRK
jgi:hypothetical protein